MKSIKRSAFRAVRQQLLGALAADSKIQLLTDAEKQESAETMAYLATIAGGSKKRVDETRRHRSAGGDEECRAARRFEVGGRRIQQVPS
jgi:hypothetical protein